jgi:hypothetical protein
MRNSQTHLDIGIIDRHFLFLSSRSEISVKIFKGISLYENKKPRLTQGTPPILPDYLTLGDPRTFALRLQARV